jgi:hypothetical protein
MAVINNKCVYRHRRLDTYEVFYVGIGTPKRPYELWDRSKFWKRIKNKAGGVIIEVLAENLTLKDAYDLEKLLISEYGRRDNNTGVLVNHTDGGDGSYNTVVSEETRRKISLINKGKKFTDQHKKRITESLKKAVRSEETLEKLRKGSTVFKKGHSLHTKEQLEKLVQRSSKKVICIITGKIWNKMKDCAIENNISSTHLSNMLSGRSTNKTTFKYLENGS